MGSLQAQEMARLADLDTALRWHLHSNHYPPLPLAFLPTCKAAIEAMEEEEAERLIDLPDGISWRDGRTAVEAWRIVESLHLGAFIGARESCAQCGRDTTDDFPAGPCPNCEEDEDG